MSKHNQEDSVSPTEETTPAASSKRPSTSRRWRRWLAGPTAIVAMLAAGLVVMPAVEAGAATALVTVTQGATGTTPTAGHPVAKATAKIGVLASAVDPVNGNVAELNDLDQIFVVVNAANEPATDFGLGTTGTLVQGDVYLVAGNGFTGWQNPIVDGGNATASLIGRPTRLAFDANGNLLFAGKTGTKAFLMAVPAATGSYYGFSSMTAGALYYLAGYNTATTPVPSPGITLPSPYTITGIVASSGLVSGGVQNVSIATNAATSTGVSYLNFTSGSLSLFGTTEAAGSVTEIAGGGTAACASGAQSLAATGASGFIVSPSSLYADTSGNVYVANAGTCAWVLPATGGTLTVDGMSTTVTAGTAYKVAGDGTSPYTTAPTSGSPANDTAGADFLGIAQDRVGNLVFGMGTGGTSFAGVYVIANASGTYYGQTMTAGHLYAIAGGTPTVLQSLTTPVVGGTDGGGNIYLADKTSHKLYELTGGPAGPPSVTSVTPTSGPQDGGNTVTVRGAGLATATKVTFGTTAVTTFTSDTATAVTFPAPAGTGTVTVTVTTSEGSATKTGAYTYVPAPMIATVTPASGPQAGSNTVTVNGTNLENASKVTFGTNGVTSFTSDTATAITLTVPAASAAGSVSVKVTTPGGLTTKANAYTYVATPTVSSVTPASGPAAGTNMVKVKGTNLENASKVTFGTTSVTSFTSDTTTAITLAAPAGTGTVTVKVTTVGGTGTKANAYKYIPGPTIMTVTPPSGPLAGGNTVTVNGTNLTNASKVTFGGSSVTTFTSDTATAIKLVVPSGTGGAVAVKVITPGGSFTKASGYTYTTLPGIATVTPTSGPVGGGNSVTITGTNLATATKVTFGTASVISFTTDTAIAITLHAPAGTAGPVTVKVTTTRGSTTKVDAYTYVPAPTVSSVAPAKGPAAGGNSVIVHGAELTNVSKVTFGANSVTTFTSHTATAITLNAPAGTAGPAVPVKVTTPGGTGTKTGAYTYVAAPTVSSVAPTSGPVAGGNSVTVHGANLATASKVTFGTASVTSFTSDTATAITLMAPAGTTGAVTVRVTTAGGPGTKPSAYTYVGVPTITKVTPATGSTAGGTAVTITGTNFTLVQTVKFGAATATSFTVTNVTTIKAVAPSGLAGKVAVVVTTPGGMTTKATAFTYVIPPILSKVTPVMGSTNGGTTVTLTGTNLTGLTAVTFGGAAATTLHVTNADTVKVKDPAHLAGAVTVAVTNGGGTATLATAFTYTVTPPAQPTGTSTWKVGSSSSAGGTATAKNGGVTATGSGAGALGVGSYPTSPTTTAPKGSTNVYYDVELAPGSNFTQVTITTCSLGGGNALDWWNGTAWLSFSSQTLSSATGCVTATVNGTTSPTLAELTGTPIAAVVSTTTPPVTVTDAYYEVASDGGIFAFGGAPFYGSMGGKPLNKPIVGIATTPTGGGYYEVASDGGIFAFGVAPFYGSMGGKPLNQPVVGISVTPTGGGYYEVASDGGIFAFGNAKFYGSMGGKPLNKPIVGIAVTPTGTGYWEVASDGGIFAFGTAKFYGSMGGKPLNQPVVGITPNATGTGYYEVASDGGIFAFGGAPFYGSMGGKPLNKPIVGITTTLTGAGYYEVASDGGIFAFGDATFQGSMGGKPLNAPVVGIATDTAVS